MLCDEEGRIDTIFGARLILSIDHIIKSVEIPIVLREILKGVSGIGFREGKPMVCD